MPTNILSAEDLKMERANALTHGLGLALGLAGVPLLLYYSATNAIAPGQWRSLLVFGLSLLLVYATSTIYHSVYNPRLKHICQRVDHISIYFLIAGTHTPFLAYYMPDATGKFYLSIIWGMAALGFLYKLFFFGRWQWLSLSLYLIMGWMAVLTIPNMMELMPPATLNGVVFGGLSYTIGVIFFAWRSLPYHHAIWHLFVIGGSLGHFWAIWEMAV